MTRKVVLLHGFLGGSWSYELVLSACRGTPDALVPPLSFHGDNAPLPSKELGFAGEVERLASLVTAFADAPVTLVGYSMGGRLALALGILHPQLVRHLVLVSSRRGLDDPIEREGRQRSDEAWAETIESQGLAKFLEQWSKQPPFRTLEQLPRDILEQERARRMQHTPAGLAAALRQFGLGRQPSYCAEVRRLDVPVTLMAGEFDEKFIAVSKQLASELPNARCVVVERASHHLLLEAPSWVARTIDEGS